ncbi:hypothetical protein AB0C68_08330 [Streptomyces tendae]|uniref:hypothetical protein n=1 Tax=Streptomyces tendae TaxID=1932 RepID=UPI0034006966
MGDENTAERVCEIVRRLSPSGHGPAKLSDALFGELGYDSLSLFELWMTIEAEFDTDPRGQQEVFDVIDVQDVVDLVIATRLASE